MTFFFVTNLDTAWGASAAAASTAHFLPLMGAAEWIFYLSLPSSAWAWPQGGF